MFPIGDDQGPGRGVPIVTIALIVLNVLAFMLIPLPFWATLVTSVPSVGASGAISGVLGGYLLMFPQNRVRVLTRGGVASVPALVVLGFWIVLQLTSQVGAIAQTSDGGGVAYMAHIGGFLAGLILVKFFAAGQPAAVRG